MELKKILEFINDEHEYQVTKYDSKGKSKTRYAFLAKLMEELGELSEGILKTDKLQRADKLINEFDLAEEFADVIFVSLILAKEMNIDINDAIEKKMSKVIERR